MLFNSLAFFEFFVIFFSLYLLLPHKRQNYLLVAASLIFYAYWDWRFVFLVMLSTLATYFIGIKIGEERKAAGKKLYFLMGIGAHLSLLIFFKYWNFSGLVLPLGISFYTFQAMSYLIDIYRGDLKPCRSVWDFTVFKLYFPQLIAGPIERAAHLLPQIERPRRVTWLSVEHGIYLFMCGLFKKILIADKVGPVVSKVFSEYPTLSALEIWMGAVAFTIQIYADFSGYTDMARGLAKMMGFDLVVNFRMPFLATNPADFWTRWHISLSNWFRDYVYEPFLAKYRSVVAAVVFTFLLNGIWHGAAWSFVFLGLYWGVLIAAYLTLRPHLRKFEARLSISSRRFLHVFSVILMFQITCFAFLIFRAGSGKVLWEMTSRLASASWKWTPFTEGNFGAIVVYIVVLLFLDLLQHYSIGFSAWVSKRPRLRFAALTTGIYIFFLIFIFSNNKPVPASDFIYFQF